jgi:hypothetical protein
MADHSKPVARGYAREHLYSNNKLNKSAWVSGIILAEWFDCLRCSKTAIRDDMESVEGVL